MHRIVWLKSMLSVALDAFASASCTELAGITIYSILGMISSVLAITPGG